MGHLYFGGFVVAIGDTDMPYAVLALFRSLRQTTDVFDRHLHTRELQGVFSSLAELFFQVREGCHRCRHRRSLLVSAGGKEPFWGMTNVLQY